MPTRRWPIVCGLGEPRLARNGSVSARVAQISQRQRRPGSRPSGNRISASGRNRAIVQGHPYAPTVSRARSTPWLQPRWAPRASNGPETAVLAMPRPAARNSQPIGLPGRCQASSTPLTGKARAMAPSVTV